MQVFKLMQKLVIDTNKQTVLYIQSGDFESEFIHTHGTTIAIKNKLKDKYNIITIGTINKNEDNYYKRDYSFSDELLRKVSGVKDYKEQNYQKICNAFKTDLADLPNIDYILIDISERLFLPYTSYSRTKFINELFNMYHDYTGNNKDILSEIDEINKNICSNIHKHISPIAFSTKKMFVILELLLFLHKNHNIKKVFNFIVDPSYFYPLFTYNNIPHINYYFGNDNRGTRNFVESPIGYIQHCYYDDQYIDYPKSPVSKSKNFIFAGSIFNNKGHRNNFYDKFFKNFSYNNSDFFIPQKLMSVYITNKPKTKTQHLNNITKTLSREFFDEVTSHKHYNDGILPIEYHKILSDYKYSLILKCTSYYDSLNFRPILYSRLDVIPFLDEEYDPSYIQIPKYLQDKLIVHSAEELMEKIDYYNNHDSERLDLLKQIRQELKIDEFLNNAEQKVDEFIEQMFA